MTGGFKISKDLTLPPESVTWVFAFLAKRGAGKTYCAAVITEEMLKAKVPVVIIDGMGIWHGLRSGKNGIGPGLPIVVIGGEHKDLPLAPQTARKIAQAIVASNISAVIDISGFSKAASRQIVTDFVEELYRINVDERHVIIEEADLWAPQRTLGPEQARCLGAFEDFVRRGGNRNLGCTLITQRSAVLNKDVLTQADCLVIGRTLAPQDKAAIMAWVQEATDKDRRQLDKWFDSLKALENGENWVWHPEEPEIFKRVKFRERETFHATRLFLLEVKKHHRTVEKMDVQEFIDRFRKELEPKPARPVEAPQAAVHKDPLPQGKTYEHTPCFGLPQPPSFGRLRQGLPSPPAVQEGSAGPEVTMTSRPPKPLSQFPEPSAPIRTGQLGPEPAFSEIADKVVVTPNVRLVKLRPTVQISANLADLHGIDEPDILTKVLVILANSTSNPKQRQDKWSQKTIQKEIETHEWRSEGMKEALAQLIRAEILTVGSAGYLKFNKVRVQVIEQDVPASLGGAGQ